LYCNENRDKLKADVPGLSFGEVGKKLGEKWKTVSDDEKKKFEGKAAELRAKYKNEKAQWEAEHSHDEDSDGKKKRKKKDPNAPKAPLTPYFSFANDVRDTVRKENPEAKFADIGKLIGERWKKLSDEAKKPYLAKSEKEKEKYKVAMEAYRKTKPPEVKAKKPTKKKPEKEKEKEEDDDDEDDDEDDESSSSSK